VITGEVQLEVPSRGSQPLRIGIVKVMQWELGVVGCYKERRNGVRESTGIETQNCFVFSYE
jgi:hypothetical protein